MTNHPNRKSERRPSCEGLSISIKRTASNVIEYVLSDESGEWTYHANRTATFHGRHTGKGDARQVMGGASTLWRERDDDMLKAFSRWYPDAEINLAI